MDPADFYTGLVARLYAPLRSSVPDVRECLEFIEESGQPALELGCGDGDPLLDLVAAGLDVDGVDSSQDMLERLERFAAERHLAVSVHRQKMQELDLPRRYRSIFFAGATFTLLPDDEAARETLRRIRCHLQDDGIALIPLWVPGRTPANGFGVFRETQVGDSVIGVATVAEDYDVGARTRRAVLRYEDRHGDGRVDAVESEWLIHWYPPSVFRSLAESAGLRVVDMRDPSGAYPAEDSAEFTVRLGRPKTLPA